MVDPGQSEAKGRPDKGLPSLGRRIRSILPTGLYARSLLIVIIPMVLLQTVVAFVFMERHWQLVTNRLSAAVSRDIAAIISLIDMEPGDRDHARMLAVAEKSLDLTIRLDPPGPLPPEKPVPFYSILEVTLSAEIARRIDRPFFIDAADGRTVNIIIQLADGNLAVSVPVGRTYASNTHIFMVWMVGSSLVLLGISILFLRGQIRPILALARAAEAFGKGQKPDSAFTPKGADEVRRAGYAFLQMRERIERQIEQRTAMLSGVSHDLRTILTRFRLQLAVAEDARDLENLNRDVEDMNSMLEGYLAFAKGGSEEDVGRLDFATLTDRLQAEAELTGKHLEVDVEGASDLHVRPKAFSRLVTNLVVNAWRHAAHVRLEARVSARRLTVTIDDDGPGIPEAMREDVFKPFVRLDEARNLDASGTGLGLAIARDIARQHGGNVTLSDSPMGGLRATIRVPV